MTSEIIDIQTADGPKAEGVSTGTSLLLPAVATAQRLAHFPAEVYDLSAESHLVRFMKALLGDSGAGQLRKRYTTARLQQTLQGAHFYDLDRFYGALFGVRRAPDEVLLVDPYQGNATSDEWSVQTARDASYRSRVSQLGRALQYGPTPTGIELAAEALLSVDCDVFESYIQADGSYQTYAELEALYGPSWTPTAPTTTKVWTNLMTNPSMEAGTVNGITPRTNVVTDPNVTAWASAPGTTWGITTARWFGGGSATGNHTLVTGASDGPISGITTYGRKTWTNVTGGGQGDTGFQTNGWTGYAVNTTYSATVWVRASTQRNFHPEVDFLTTPGVTTERLIPTTSTVVSVPANTWTKLQVSFTTPSVAGQVQIFWDTDAGTAWQVGDTLDITGFLCEVGGTQSATNMRINLHTNPSVNFATTGWSASTPGVTPTITRETSASGMGGAWPSQTWYKVLCPTAPTSSPATINVTATGTSGIPVTAGQTYVFAAYAASSYTGYAAVRLDVGWYDAAGAAIGSDTTTQPTLAAVNTWERRSKILVAPAGAAFASLGVAFSGPTSAPVNTWMGVQSVLVEQTGTLATYFDGFMQATTVDYGWSGTPGASTSVQRLLPVGIYPPYFGGTVVEVPDSDLTPSFSGTANASTTILRGDTVTGITAPLTADRHAIIRSGQWSANRSKSLRIIPIGSNADSFAEYDSASLPTLSTLAGKTITLFAKHRTTQVITSPTVRYGQFRVAVALSGGGSTEPTITYLQTAPNTPGEHEVRATLDIPADATGAWWVRLYHGSNYGSGDVWWDDLMLVEGVYLDDYFDGASTDTPSWDYTWVGSADASTSTGSHTISTNAPNNGSYAGMEGVTYGELEGASLARQSGDNRKYFTVRPKRAITQSEAYELGRVLDRIKPVDSRWIIDATGSDPYIEVEPRAALADSTYWEVISRVSARVEDDASSPYQVTSSTPVEQPRPPFTSYQGEAWSYISDVIGVAAYQGDPATSTLPELVEEVDGTRHLYQPVYALTPRRYVLAGRAASDGILVTNPAWGAAPTAPASSLAPLLVDGMNLDTLTERLAANPIDALPQNPENRYWATPKRLKTDPTPDMLAVSLTQTRLINYVSVEVARYPHRLTVEAWDGNAWVAITSREVYESSPQYIAPGRTEPGHPQHNFPAHWARQGIKFPAAVETNSLRFKMVRLEHGNAPRSDATTEIPYSLALRSIEIGYRVLSLDDIPAAALDGSVPVSTSVDLLDSPIEYYLRTEAPNNAINGQQARWISEPQPVNYAVVNFFLDVRNEDEDAQVIDRFFLHPTHPGASMSIYTTEAVWSESGDPTQEWLAQQPWRPIPRDYRLQKGYVYIPPTSARFVKFEFTALTPEQMETLLPITRRVRLFPQYLINEMAAQTAGEEALPAGVSTAMQIGDREAYADAITALRLETYDQTLYDPVEALYADNPAMAQRLREVSWVYGFTPWHQGSNAPRFTKTQVHDYEVVEVAQQTKVGFFVGLYEVRAFTVDVGANDDTKIYDEPFFNFRNLAPGFTWTFNPNALTTGVVDDPVVVQSQVYSSLHDVSAIQFATQQTEPVQVIPDDDFRDPILATIDWLNNPDGWHQHGDAIVVYSPTNHSARIARYSTPLLKPNPRSKSLVQRPVHPTFSTRAYTWTMPYPPTEGGIESPAVGVSGAGEIYVAVRITFLTQATSPAYVQVIRHSTGTVLKEFEIVGLPSEAVERYFKVDPDGEDAVRVRVIQRGVSDDVIEVDRLSLFDVGMVWEFSVNGGETWVRVEGGIRNNAQGILTFPDPGNQLMWRVTGYRSFMVLNHLRIRPRYQGVQNARDNGEQRGANVSAYDAAVPITEDPMFTTWSKPVPRNWFLAYRRLPTLVSGSGPSETEFARFYGRPLSESVSAASDAVARKVIARRDIVEFARNEGLGPEGNASDTVARVIFLKRATADTAPEPTEEIVHLEIEPTGHAVVNRLPHLT